VSAFAFPAGIGIVDKYGLIDALEMINQDMMHDPVPEVSGEDFPQFGFS